MKNEINSSVLTPGIIRLIDGYFKEKFSAFCVLEDFCENLSLIIDRGEEDPMDEKIQGLVTDMAFESEDSESAFIHSYAGYFNGILALLNEFEHTEDPMTLLDTHKDIIDALFSTYPGGKEKIHESLGEYSSLVVETVFANYGFDPSQYNGSDALIEGMNHTFDDIIIMALVPLSEILVHINKEKAAADEQLAFALGLVVLLAVCMNTINKNDPVQ
ncbi:MAG: hypothetical protein ACRCUT_11940 [Spirochaetota bacterium]